PTLVHAQRLPVCDRRPLRPRRQDPANLGRTANGSACAMTIQAEAGLAAVDGISKELADILEPVFATPGLGARVSNVLRSEGILTVADLCMRSEAELLRCPNFGVKSLTMIAAALKAHGLHIGCKQNIPLERDLRDVSSNLLDMMRHDAEELIRAIDRELMKRDDYKGIGHA